VSTLAEYRAFLCRELGEYIESTAAAGCTTLALLDAKWPVKSTLDQSDLYLDRYLLRPDAVVATDRVRVVKSYMPQSGELDVDAIWTNAPSNGERYCLVNTLDPTEIDVAINDTLKRTLVVDELAATPTAGTQRHALTTLAPWLKIPTWVRQVGWLPNGADRNVYDPYTDYPVRGTVEVDGESIYIKHPGRYFNTADLIYVKVVKPAYYHTRPAAGTWGAQSGLALDTDEALPDVKWVAMGALSELWRRHSNLLDAGANGRLIKGQLDAESAFARLTDDNFTSLEPRRTFQPAAYFHGPRRGSRGYGF
jgi:hypothetical protein